MKKIRGFLLWLYGMAFGSFLVIPGLSGGGILAALGSYDIVCAEPDFKQLRNNPGFYAPFGIGVLLGVTFGAWLLGGLFKKYPLPCYFFVIGLMLGSIPYIYRCAVKTEKFRAELFAPAIMAFLAVIGISLAQNIRGEEYTLSQKRSPEQNSYTVTFTNKTGLGIRDVYFIYNEGDVIGAGGAELFRYESITDKLFSSFSDEAEEKPNALRPFTNSDSKKDVYTFTYIPGTSRTVEFEPKVSYSAGFRIIIELLTGCFISGAALFLPGFSPSAVMNSFGINTTVTGGFLDLDFLVIIPSLPGFIFGIIMGVRFIRWMISNYPPTFYFMLGGLVLGGIYSAFPKEITIDPLFAIGLGAFIVGGALSLAIGMERKSNEEVKITLEIK